MIDSRGRVVSLLFLPLALLLAAAACSDSDSGGSSGGVGGIGAPSGGSSTIGGSLANGGSKAAGGAFVNPGSGGTESGGTKSTGSAGTGTNAGTGGVTSGGANTGTAGQASGGAHSGSGGRANAGSGGLASGGNAGTAAGGASAGSGAGGASTGGGSGSVFHIFMLMGQSNMAGVAKLEQSDKNTDERIKVLGGCNQPAGQWNIANPPLSDCPGEKGWNLSDSVDPGIWFAKTIVKKLPAGHTIGLVGTAESGESITTFISGGSHHQMILNKIAKAKTAPNARFAGIIFHQGESDNGQAAWPGKVVQLYNEVKAAFGVTYDVPFILGELPQGGCCAGHNNLVRQAADQLPDGYWVSQEGTRVMDEYHFDHASVVLMGQRYGEKMLEALKW